MNTQNEGWYRIELDRLGIPFDYISDQDVGKMANLREKYDVIIWGPVGGNAQSIVRGIAKFSDSEAAIPWKGSALTPNMGMSPDQTDDIRGGMGIQGVANLQNFVESGGLFITVGGNADIPIDFGMVSGVSIVEARNLQARGSVINASFADRKSPIAYGYDETLAVYFNQAPLLQVATIGGGGGFGGGQGGNTGRPTGRGTETDPDIVQGRKPPEGAQPSPTPDTVQIPPVATRPRVVLRFAASEKDLLASGMLAGGSELAGKAAVVDAPVGRGHIVMFANNPMWRHQTHGSFSLLFNAILNFDNLGVGREEAARTRTGRTDDEDYDQEN